MQSVCKREEHMLQVKFFLNEPNGKPWKHFKKMMPGLGDKYEIKIESLSKPKADYLTDEYFELDLPVAPAVMVGDEIIVEGADVSQEKLESAICTHLGLPEPTVSKDSIVIRLFKRWLETQFLIGDVRAERSQFPIDVIYIWKWFGINTQA